MKKRGPLRSAAVEMVIECPHCEGEVSIPADVETVSCPECGRDLQARAQRAYARGYAYFLQARELAERFDKPGFGRANQSEQGELRRLYQLAYSGLQVAIQWELPPGQKELTLGMLADISGDFVRQGRVSALEADYWSRVSLRIGFRQQYAQVREELEDSHGGLGGVLTRLRLWPRQLYLRKMLETMDEKVAELEQRIQFANPPQI